MGQRKLVATTCASLLGTQGFARESVPGGTKRVVSCWGFLDFFVHNHDGYWGNVKNVRGGSFCEEGVVKGNVCFNGKKELHAVWYSLEKASNTSFFSVYACFSQSSLI